MAFESRISFLAFGLILDNEGVFLPTIGIAVRLGPSRAMGLIMCVINQL